VKFLEMLDSKSMSALGHKQTFAAQKVMSALPPKADVRVVKIDVRFGPIAYMAQTALPAHCGEPGNQFHARKAYVHLQSKKQIRMSER
jgi:hypothetical protein